MNRRQVLGTLGGSACAWLSGCKRATPIQTFSTVAFGTEVHFRTHGLSDISFASIASETTDRLRELESLFSLYDTNSAISRLNQQGELRNAPKEFSSLINTALSMSEQTDGIFDITVQPLWQWRNEWKQAGLEERTRLGNESWKKTLELVDYRNVSIKGNTVAFSKPGMAITLNGIVQGFATEKIKELMQDRGIKNALVNIGEYAAMGSDPDGAHWMVEIQGENSIVKSTPLKDGRALAVSAAYGNVFEPTGRFHHLFRPGDGSNPRPRSTISVSSSNATQADALATTFAVATDQERKKMERSFPDITWEEFSG